MRKKVLRRSLRRAIEKRKDRDEIYVEKRERFEVEPVFSGWFGKKFDGWVVNALRVEGVSTAALGGSMGYVVEDEISPLFPTKFGAYRWLVENVKDFDDLSYFGVY